MPTLRRATLADAALITHHRHVMFADNGFASEDRFAEMDAVFEPWLREHLANDSYIGLLIPDEQDPTKVLAAGGIYLQPFPPHWMHLEPRRAYLLNFYTAPEARGRGYAGTILEACVEQARVLGFDVVTLHASPMGRPIYERFGFTSSSEMMLRLTK